MMTDDQQRMTISMEQALLQCQSLIDGRTERDWLGFIANFASLINFYDHHNRQRGNWEPFILKDPVFLTATISRTDYLKSYSYYTNTCNYLNKLLPQTDKQAAIGEAINKLFEIVFDVFLTIRKWVYYMQLSTEEYPLKTFTLNQVKEVYSQYLWAITSLRHTMVSEHFIEESASVNRPEISLFDAVDGLIWKQKKETEPYWELLGLKYPVRTNKLPELVDAIKAIADKVFHFQQSLVVHAASEMEQLKTRKTRFPDTLLLRAFVDMLQLQQEQLNLITSKHLNFYYRDILKLRERDAEPDSVFICAEPTTKNINFLLPAATSLDAGVDELGNPVLFTTVEDVQLQPAEISGVYTITTSKESTNKFKIYRDYNASPGTLQQDADGKIKTWKTFGGSSNTANAISQAISFASPILLLREGERYITITLNLDAADPTSFDEVNLYLSTQLKWLPVKGQITNTQFNDNKQLTQLVILVRLDPSQPPIEPFLKDPDGIQSDWPLFKIEFLSFSTLTTAPALTSIKLDVTVIGIKTLLLYNDGTPLNPKADFQPFGPAPLVNNDFIIGSNEIFSKSLNAFQLQITWSKLPPDFADYYKEYNAYLSNSFAKKKKTGAGKLLKWIGGIFSKLWQWISWLYGRKSTPQQTQYCPPFNNTSFKAGFSILRENKWQNFSVNKVKDFINADNILAFSPYVTDPGCACKPDNTSDLLFSTDGAKCQLVQDSCFAYITATNEPPAFILDPSIQQSPLAYSGKNMSGFLKITLSGPEHGFGSDIYSSVVTAVALQNAWLLYNSNPGTDFFGFQQEKDKPVFIGVPKTPFAPKASAVEANYSATQVYEFSTGKNNYPIQCFHYTAFGNYKVYDNTGDASTLNPPANVFYNQPYNKNGVPLFQSIQNQGYLFITFDNLFPSAELSLYFELRRKLQTSSSKGLPTYFYLSDNGWKELKVLSDGTYNFTCSGILKLIIPPDISKDGSLIPGNKFWISISYKDDPTTKAETAFLKTNGFSAKRVLSPTNISAVRTFIKGGTIKKPSQPIPQIIALVQPFPSFGGKTSESESQMFVRVANRLSTKDRAVTKSDFYKLIKEEFPDIYFSNAIYNKTSQSIEVYVIGYAENENESNTLLPLVYEPTMVTIQQMLTGKTSSSNSIAVSNYALRTLQIIVTLVLKPGFAQQKLSTNLNSSLGLYLSPWIKGNQTKIELEYLTPGRKVNPNHLKARLVSFIKTLEGVADVKNIELKSWAYEDSSQIVDGIVPGITGNPTTGPIEHYLLIPALEHIIKT